MALLNPKTALFFAAYLPQFLPTSKAPIAQTLVFGSIFVLIAATTDSVYAVAAGSLKPWLAKGRELADFGNKLAGGIYIGLIYKPPAEKLTSITQLDDLTWVPERREKNGGDDCNRKIV